MADEQNGFIPSKHGIQERNARGSTTNGTLSFRVAHLERCFDDISDLGNALRVGQTLREEQIRTIRADLERHDRVLEAYIKEQAALAAVVNKKIDDINGTLNEKIQAMKSGNSRWFIAILTTVLTSFVLIVLSRWITP